MSKQNNLKDFLADLYQGIVSKKPDASKNPQNFRSEVEAIETAPEWDGTFTVTGEPTTDSGSGGGEGGNTFTFKIDNVEYTSEAGMSWEEWVNSAYNTRGVWIDTHGEINVSSGIVYPSDVYQGNLRVYSWEGIVKDYNYRVMTGGGSYD